MYRDRAPNLTTVYWLIENPGAGRPGELTVHIDASREALPVFSYPEEAEMFLRLGGLEERGWRIAESTAGELVSRLPGYRRAGIDLIALDPLPEMMGSALDTTIALVTLSLRGFARRHTARPREQLARS
jgi:hypothetical protein